MSHNELTPSGMSPDDVLAIVWTDAGHPDEGSLQTWLDDAFDAASTTQVQAHVTGCAVCQREVATLRGYMAAASRILGALDDAPAGVVSPADSAKAAAAIVAQADRRTRAEQKAAQAWFTRPAFRVAAALALMAGGTTWVMSRAPVVVRTTADVAVPAVAAPIAEAPVAEAPVANTDMAKTPKAETLKAETPKAETPKAETPRASANVAEVRVTSTPSAAQPLARSAPALSAQDFSGRGVAGGMARGVAGTVSPEIIRPRAERRRDEGGNREQYDKIDDNPFLAVSVHPRSTFSVDVDRASYSNVRRFIAQEQTPPPDAVRIEELINYFPYDLPSPTGNAPVSITTETMAAPWQPKHRLVRVALQARRIETAALPPSNLVFLIDVSGSMNQWNKLPLVKASLRLLVDQLRPQDHVALVVYAGAAGLVLPSTSGDEKAAIVAALDRLEAGGSTAGGAGIELAYRTAREHFKPDGNNRVILATDGDFNVGASSDGDMERLIESKRAEGTYLTVLGFGQGNYQDAKMEKLAKRGNGNYAYVDDIAEARKVLVQEMGATLVTVANDVKLQVEFNPAAVRAYCLIGYEDRLLATEDFTNDKKDAGDMGAGHSVTALYEVVPNGVTGTITLREQDSLRYQIPATDAPRTNAAKNELMFVRMRYKTPGENTSKQVTQAVIDGRGGRASNDFRFAAAVAEFGMVLRNSEHKGTATLRSALEKATAAQGSDAGGYRSEFVYMLGRLLNSERR
jgi:Ca-activated chloride channel homolog